MQTKRLNASIGMLVIASWFVGSGLVRNGFAQKPVGFSKEASAKSSPGIIQSTPGFGTDLSSNLHSNNHPEPSKVKVVTEDPNQLVLKAIHQSVWGPPVACKTFQTSRAYNQQVISSGEYKSNGGGTGQFRHTARISSGETTIDTIQISDGRMMYTQIGVQEAPRRVIIEQVRQSMGNALVHASNRPDISIHLAIGGHPELLRNLYHRYRWYKAIEGPIAGVWVTQLVGKLRTEPPKPAGGSLVDQQSYAPLPADSPMPEIVRLTLGASGSLEYFPYMVEYFRRTESPDDPPDAIEPVSKLVHTDATTAVTISEKDFYYKVQDSVDRIDDETKLYMPPASIAGAASLPIK